MLFGCCVFFFKQKTAYDMRISDWSSDVCSSDLTKQARLRPGFSYAITVCATHPGNERRQGVEETVDDDNRAPGGASCSPGAQGDGYEIGRASCRERVCQYV